MHGPVLEIYKSSANFYLVHVKITNGRLREAVGQIIFLVNV
jgi:hypothetical protein